MKKSIVDNQKFIQYIGVAKGQIGRPIKSHEIRKYYELIPTYPRIEEIIKVYVEAHVTDHHQIPGFCATSVEGIQIGEVIGVICGAFHLKVEYLDDNGQLSTVSIKEFFTTYISGSQEEVEEQLAAPFVVSRCLVDAVSESEIHYFAELRMYY